MTNAQLTKLRHSPVGPSGNRLAAAFEITGVTQNACCRATGFLPGYVTDMKNRGFNLRIESARKFARFFGCAIEDLFPDPEAR